MLCSRITLWADGWVDVGGKALEDPQGSIRTELSERVGLK